MFPDIIKLSAGRRAILTIIDPDGSKHTILDIQTPIWEDDKHTIPYKGFQYLIFDWFWNDKQFKQNYKERLIERLSELG